MLIQKFRNTNEKGFTLIELMIVIAIIGILAAIAVPQFMAYRIRSYNAAAKAVVHNMKADQGNLNSELGAYGHTEVGPLALTAATAGASFADTQAAPAMRLAATAATAGARLAGSHATTGRDLSIGAALGNNMVASAVDNGLDPSSHIAMARHYKGDTAYGLDADVENALYTVSNPNWPATNGLGAAAAPSTINVDDFTGLAGAGLPTVNWMLSE